MSRYVMGIDAGGTKSHLAIFDDEASLVAFGSWGPLNHEVLPGSFGQLEKELHAFISKTAQPHGIGPGDIAYAVFGLGGVDTKEQHRVISDIITRLGIARFTLCNDAYLGVAAACPDNTGICAINGSGCTIAGIGAAGEMLQIGGIGELSRDLGGASQISMSVLGAVYESLFREGGPTALARPVLEALGIKDKYDYTDAVSAKLTDKSFHMPGLNRLLFQYSDDGVSQRLLSDIAKNYTGGISCMLRELDFSHENPVHIVFAGSVFAKEKNPVLIDMIKEMLADLHPGSSFIYTILKVPPVAGAVIWALRGIGITKDVSGRVSAQLERML